SGTTILGGRGSRSCPARGVFQVAGETARRIEVGAAGKGPQDLTVARERSLERCHRGALGHERLRGIRSGQQFLSLAHRDGGGTKIALAAVPKSAFLQLRRLLRLDLLILYFAAEHEDELRANHALLHGQIERRISQLPGRHRRSTLMQTLRLDNQHLLAQRVAGLLLGKRERIARCHTELRDLDEKSVRARAAVAGPLVGGPRSIDKTV